MCLSEQQQLTVLALGVLFFSPPFGKPSYQILDTRRYQQQNVFKPSHALPTYTVEEWGEIEAARMRETMRKEEAERRRKEAQGEVDSDNEDIQDQKTLEARNWDDWKDEHNKGSGNTLR